MSNPKKILIFEDDKALSRVVENKLSAEGYEVKVLSSGKDALSVIKEEKPDLILLDLVMPQIDGFTVLKAVNEDEELKGIKIIVLSNLSQDVDVETVMKLGVKEFLIKSNTPLNTITEVIKKHLT